MRVSPTFFVCVPTIRGRKTSTDCWCTNTSGVRDIPVKFREIPGKKVVLFGFRSEGTNERFEIKICHRNSLRNSPAIFLKFARPKFKKNHHKSALHNVGIKKCWVLTWSRTREPTVFQIAWISGRSIKNAEQSSNTRLRHADLTRWMKHSDESIQVWSGTTWQIYSMSYQKRGWQRWRKAQRSRAWISQVICPPAWCILSFWIPLPPPLRSDRYSCPSCSRHGIIIFFIISIMIWASWCPIFLVLRGTLERCQFKAPGPQPAIEQLDEVPVRERMLSQLTYMMMMMMTTTTMMMMMTLMMIIIMTTLLMLYHVAVLCS